MIKVNDLRVGNLLTFNDYILTVNVINNEFNSVNSFKLDNIKPIPLTEEILLKCGFEEYSSKDLIYRIKPYLDLGYDLESNKMYLLSGQFAEWSTTIECIYLHQLQNLYFALTGEELTVNL